ncbi:type 1 fimbrial protein [Enterobacteriaceae bacterium 89]|nr:type 1 fimbrial protein [Enterobacteriaceae bacterium 89]
MKKITLAAMAISTVAMSTAVNSASTGTITFTGELTATTCDVSVDGQGADATIVLPTIGTSQLDAATKTAGETGFIMALSNCAGTLQTASAFFENGGSVEATTGRLKNMTGTATNVSLQLLDASSPGHAVIQAGNASQTINTTWKEMSGGSATLPYSARYYAEAPTTPGTVVSNVVYSIQYQ